ncbi:MAG: YncE family protein, partial [Actinomycetota bacterium]|nr:YncE family protein [Actinomycetota bacterium]
IVVDARTGLAAIATRNPSAIVLLDARSGHLVRRVPVAGPARHLKLVRPGGPVLVPEEPAGRLLELSLPDGGTRSIAVGAHPHDSAAAGGRIFVSDEFGQRVAVVAGSSVLRTIGGFSQPGGLVSAGDQVAVVDVRTNSVTLVDARTLRVRGRLPAGTGPTHVVSGPGGRLYVIDTRGGAVFTYATRPALRLLGRLSLPGGPYGVAIDPTRGRLWITLTATDQLVELATGGASLSLRAQYGTYRQPNTVAVDPRDGRVLVADAGPGLVQLIDPRH